MVGTIVKPYERKLITNAVSQECRLRIVQQLQSVAICDIYMGPPKKWLFAINLLDKNQEGNNKM